MSYMSYPYSISPDGRTAVSSLSAHLGSLIRQVIFTGLGERVNRPDFGSGMNRIVFEPLSGDVGGSIAFLIQAELERQLLDKIEVQEVGVEQLSEGNLTVSVTWRTSPEMPPQTDSLTLAAGGSE